MKSKSTIKVAMIASVSAAIMFTSCKFESDNDYKTYPEDSTAHEGAHGTHDATTPAHGEASPGAPHEATGHESTTNPALHNGDSTSTSTSPITDTSSTAKAKRKGRATFNDWAVDPSAKKEADADGVYSVADVMPEYPGGKQAIQKFIDNNTEYPQSAMDEDIEGTVRVSFAIDEAGNVTKAAVTGAKVGHGLDEEALRVVKKMGKWKPGKVNGKNVKVRLSLPVTFLIS